MGCPMSGTKSAPCLSSYAGETEDHRGKCRLWQHAQVNGKGSEKAREASPLIETLGRFNHVHVFEMMGPGETKPGS